MKIAGPNYRIHALDTATIFFVVVLTRGLTGAKYGIIIITRNPLARPLMSPRRPSSDPKLEALREQGTANPRPEDGIRPAIRIQDPSSQWAGFVVGAAASRGPTRGLRGGDIRHTVAAELRSGGGDRCTGGLPRRRRECAALVVCERIPGEARHHVGEILHRIDLEQPARREDRVRDGRAFAGRV